MKQRRSLKIRSHRFLRDVVVHTPIVKMIFILIVLWMVFAAALYFAEQGNMDLEEPIIEVRDSTFKRGTVGFRPGSLPNSAIDNISVTTPGRAVKVVGKLATTWASIKTQ